MASSIGRWLIDGDLLHARRSWLAAQSSHDLFARDGMLANAHAAGVVDGVGDGARHRADTGFAEAFDAIEPARLVTVDENLGLLRRVHDGREPIGQIADAVVARAGEFAVPGDGVGGNLGAFNEGANHIGFGDQRVDHDSRVVRVDGADEAPVAGPCVDFNLGETSADALIGARAGSAVDAASVGFDRALRSEGGEIDVPG